MLPMHNVYSYNHRTGGVAVTDGLSFLYADLHLPKISPLCITGLFLVSMEQQCLNM